MTQANFNAATASDYPPVVYLRSEALSRLATRKTAVELKSSGHEDRTDAICTLQESHALGRYHLGTEKSVSFRVQRDLNITKLDFGFYDNRTSMPSGGVVSSGSAAAAGAVTAADIEALHDDGKVIMWLPMMQMFRISHFDGVISPLG